MNKRLSKQSRSGKITLIRDAVHEAGIDDDACAQRVQTAVAQAGYVPLWIYPIV
jgi:hypothetical protein